VSSPGFPLRVRDLRRNFGKVQALTGVSLDLGEPGVVGLIGPNGSGKTTFVNLISGFLRPSGGTIHWHDHDITHTPAYRITRLGISRTFQHAVTFAGLTVRQNAVIALEAAKRPRSEFEALLGGEEATAHYGPLLDYVDEPAGELPFGIARLLGIALAMASSPKLLMLDEPAAGLNDAEASELGTAIREIAATGTAVVMIDHDMHFLLPLCQRVVVFDAGGLMADGTPEEIRNDPRVIAVYLGETIAQG
jgi:ABC-type branched-subunit amino acid transport system ATPase component